MKREKNILHSAPLQRNRNESFGLFENEKNRAVSEDKWAFIKDPGKARKEVTVPAGQTTASGAPFAHDPEDKSKNRILDNLFAFPGPGPGEIIVTYPLKKLPKGFILTILCGTCDIGLLQKYRYSETPGKICGLESNIEHILYGIISERKSERTEKIHTIHTAFCKSG